MGLRESLGGQLEEYLNKSLDKNFDLSTIKKKMHEEMDKIFDKYITDELKHKIKADIIDLVDGEDDIK